MAVAPTVDEIALAERFFQGDDDAVREILHDLGPPLRSMLRRKYSTLLPFGEEKCLVLMALDQARRHGHLYDPTRGPLGAWICAIADHVTADFVESPGNQARLLEMGMGPDQLASLVDPRGDLFDSTAACEAEASELDKLVDDALDAIPARQRFVLLADASSRDGQVSSGALAEEMGITASSVRHYRQRGLPRLEEELRSRGVEKLLPAPHPNRITYRGTIGTGNGERGTGNGERGVNDSVSSLAVLTGSRLNVPCWRGRSTPHGKLLTLAVLFYHNCL